MEEEKREVIETQRTDNETTQVNATENPKNQRKGFCVASMVLGIIALIFFCIWYVSIPCAILAIIFGILGLKAVNRGMAIAGLVTGSIGLAISIIIIVMIAIFGFAIFTEALDDIDTTYNKSNYHYSLYD